MSAVCRLGFKSGSVIFLKRVHAFAPKISAASAYSFGMSCTPATRMTSTMAVARQISARTIATNIEPGFSADSQLTGPSIIPSANSAELR